VTRDILEPPPDISCGAGCHKCLSHGSPLASDLAKRATARAFRHCFAAHLLVDGYDIRTVRERSMQVSLIMSYAAGEVTGLKKAARAHQFVGGSC
jgi:site-specific recombinase XerD